MKPKSPALRFTFLLFVSLLWNGASILTPSTTYLPASEVGATVTGAGDSDYRLVVIWGAPFPFVQDMLNSQRIGDIDNQDRFSGAAFLADWFFWFVVTWPLSFVGAIFYAFLIRLTREIAKPTQEK